jgi:hypothetical protein
VARHHRRRPRLFGPALCALAAAGGCDWTWSGAPRSPPLLLDGFELGPGRQTTAERNCFASRFADQKPTDGTPCDLPGLTPQGCGGGVYCDAGPNAGVCLDHLNQANAGEPTDLPVEGNYALRINHSEDGTREWTDNMGQTSSNAFAGIFRWFSGDSLQCPSANRPLDLSKIKVIRMMVRFNDDAGNLEMALQDQTGCETSPKAKLFRNRNDSPAPNTWTPVWIPMCALLWRHADNPCSSGTARLNDSAIRALLLGVERDDMNGLGFHRPGPRSADVDGIVAEEDCPASGCPPCPPYP